jgi:site-specific DNA-methyltransferase (adenine-specific)
MKKLISILRYGKIHIGLNKKPKLCAAYTKTPRKSRDCWQTPRALFERLDYEFNFDCDVAADPRNALCEWFFTKETSALARKYWGWSNFCNPPYSREGGGKIAWIEKAAEQNRLWKSTVMLLPADTGSKWFRIALRKANEIRFLVGGRVRHINPEIGKGVSNFFPSVLIIFRGVPNTGQAAISFMEVVR